MSLHEGNDARVVAEVFDSGTAGKKEAIGPIRHRFVQGGVGLQGETAFSGHLKLIAEGGERDIKPGPTHEIGGGHCFDFFKTWREDCENRGHAFDGKHMSRESHRFFVGKHLVVLGAGYVGGEVARQGVARGMNVTVLTRNALKAEELRREGMTAVVADLASEEWHAKISAETDFVLNSVSSGGGGVEQYRRSYVEGMRSIGRWAQSGRPGRLVYTGSTSVYPQGDGALGDESCPTRGTNERTALLVEAEARLREANAFTHRVVLRLAGIYGPGRHHLLNQVLKQEPLAGDGTHRLNLIHRDDICGAVWACFESAQMPVDAVYNVSDGSPVTKRELAEWLAKRLELAPPEFDPTLPSPRRRMVPDRVIANHALQRELGWRPRYSDYRSGYEAILASR